jgi:cyanophycinase
MRLFICSVITLFSFLTGSAQGKLFIIGGGDRPDAMVTRLIQESGIDKGGYAVVLPMSSAQPDSSVIYTSEQFFQQNIKSIKGIFARTSADVTVAKADSVRKAKLIYITGGDQSRFMGIIGGTAIETAILDAYKNGATISGTSAGAAVMSKLMITGNQLKYPDASFNKIEEKNIELTRGLGLLTNVIIDQHFLIRSRYSRLISVVIENSITGIGIDESTAILVKGTDVEVIGNSQVIVISNPTKEKALSGTKLGAKNMKLSVYLAGEKFSIKN